MCARDAERRKGEVPDEKGEEGGTPETLARQARQHSGSSGEANRARVTQERCTQQQYDSSVAAVSPMDIDILWSMICRENIGVVRRSQNYRGALQSALAA